MRCTFLSWSSVVDGLDVSLRGQLKRKARSTGPRRRGQAVAATLFVQNRCLYSIIFSHLLVRPFDNKVPFYDFHQYVTHELKTSSFRLTLIDRTVTTRVFLTSRSDQGRLQQQSGQSAGHWKPARSIHVTKDIKSTR